MVRTTRRLSGDKAEKLAFERLRRAGLKPVARNFHCRRGEIDLIMLDGDCLVFVDVRYRGSDARQDAIATVDQHKQRKLIQTASVYLSSNPRFHSHSCRFDVVGVDRQSNGDDKVTWLSDAFRA